MEAKEFLSTKDHTPIESGTYIVWFEKTGYDVFWWDGDHFFTLNGGYEFNLEEIDLFHPLPLPDLNDYTIKWI